MSTEQIADLVHRYADAVVHRDGERWGATWAPESTWNLGPGHAVEGRDEIVSFWRRAMGAFEAVVQTVLNGSAQVDDAAGSGTGRWYVQEHYRRVDGESGLLLAHYDDAYTFVEGRWCFASRALVVHYSGPPDLSAPFLNAPKL